MKTDKLEDFIKSNRGDFDQHEPSDKVWEQISKSQKKTKTVKMSTWVTRVAAVIAIAVVLSVLVVKTNVFQPNKLAMQSNDPELLELIEAEAYYAGRVNEKMIEIRKCYHTNPGIKQDVETDLNELQEMYNILKIDLKENVSKKAVIEAMIENNRFRLKMVDQVLEQINC